MCPLCKRDAPLTAHHLIPKSLGGKETTDVCRGCHNAIHAFIPHKELKRHYHTIERLLEHPDLARTVKWIARQDPNKRLSFDRPNNQRGRSKYR